MSYLLVEVITGLSFLILLILNDYKIDWLLFRNLVFFLCGISVIFIDAKHFIIPDVISLPMIVLGILFSFVVPLPFTESLPGWQTSLNGAILGFSVFFAIAWFFKKVKKQDGLGGGDIKYIAGVGAFTGWVGVLFVLFFSSFLALIVYMFSILLGNKQERVNIAENTENIDTKQKREIAYGPFITIASFIFLLAGDFIIDWYFGFFHL